MFAVQFIAPLCRATLPPRLPLPAAAHTTAALSSSSSSDGTPTEVLKPGDVLRLKRLFSETEVAEYARVTGDANPVHFDAEFARSSAGFDGQIVHGMLVASLFPAIIASHFPGAIYASQTLQFKLPVYPGDEVLAEVRSVNLRKNRNKYIAKFLTKCFKGGDQLVLDGEALAILPTLDLKI